MVWLQACGGQGVECGGLNKNAPPHFMCLNAWPIESDNIRRYGLVGVGVALLEEMYHCGCGLWDLLCSSYA